MLDCGVHMQFNDDRKYPDFSKLFTNSSSFKKKLIYIFLLRKRIK